MAKRFDAEDIDVPTYADEVAGGYPTAAFVDEIGAMRIHVYAPVMASPRPRVTTRGTFMPSDYRKHCDKLSCSLAHARGVYEGHLVSWPAGSVMSLDLSFCCPKMPGDLDNLAKTTVALGNVASRTGPRSFSPLDTAKVVAMRDQRRKGASLKALAKAFDVSVTTVSKVVNQLIWRDVLR